MYDARNMLSFTGAKRVINSRGKLVGPSVLNYRPVNFFYMNQIRKFEGNHVDFCRGNTCVKTKGPAADIIAGIIVVTTLVACLAFITKLIK